MKPAWKGRQWVKSSGGSQNGGAFTESTASGYDQRDAAHELHQSGCDRGDGRRPPTQACAKIQRRQASGPPGADGHQAACTPLRRAGTSGEPGNTKVDKAVSNWRGHGAGEGNKAYFKLAVAFHHAGLSWTDAEPRLRYAALFSHGSKSTKDRLADMKTYGRKIWGA